MPSFDTITWQALTAVLTAVGVGATVVLWRRRGATAGLRMLAVSLLPAAAYLTGTLRLLWEVAAAVVDWALGLTFSPTVWLGLGLLTSSVVLFLVAGRLRRREGGVAARGHAQAQALPRSRTRPPASPAGQPSPDVDDDMADIEAILRRHGIS